MMIMFSFVAEAKWSCFSKYDKMDDVHINGCSTDDISGYRTFRGIPTLYVRTTNNELEIYLSAGEYVGNIEDIEVRFDNTPKETIGVSSSTDNVAMFVDESQTLAFTRKIMKHKKLLVRFTPLNENPRTLEFNLIGFNSKNSTKLIGIVNRLIDNENKKIEEEKKEAALLLMMEEKDKAMKEEKLNQMIESLKNKGVSIEDLIVIKKHGAVTGEICEKYAGTWNWNGSFNECVINDNENR